MRKYGVARTIPVPAGFVPEMDARAAYRGVFGVACLALVLVVPVALAQDREPGQQEAPRGQGAQVMLTNSGFGLGGYVRRLLRDDQVFTVEVTVSNTKDEREVAFFDRFGRQDVPNKANYLLEIPLQLGIERRVFRSRIEDNFRPFFHVSAGPVLGWVYPYFGDDNNNGTFDTGERTYGALSGVTRGRAVPGLSASVSIGANFGELEGASQGVRIGFRVSRFHEPIELLERTIKPPERVLMTPMILVYFGRLTR
jgi:hypothetical protein